MTGPDREIQEMARAEANDCLDRIESSLLALESGAGDPDTIDAAFRDAHSIKGTAGMVGWQEISSIAHAMEDRLADCRETGEFPPELADPLLKATDALRRALAGETVAVAPVIAKLDVRSSAEATNGPVESTQDTQRARGQGNGAGSGHGAQRSIRVAAEKVDKMLDAVGETALHQRRLDHLLGDRINTAGDEVADEELDLGERLIGELQESVLEMRTLPLSSITTPFPRAVRDLAAAEGKEVELVISGGDTPLDRAILDGIAEQITHLLRNAVAHGIEPPEERERAGKSPLGRVELRAEQRGSMVAIEVIDDGRGVTPELLARAEAEGSLTDVLAAAGFSTAKEVSEVAGRGVGLDSVRNLVEKLGGTLEVRSEPSRGSTVILLLPLTLALLEILLCERAGQPFGLPLAAVREVLAVAETTSLGGRPSVELRGEAIPLGDLAAMIGASAEPLPESAPAMVLESPARSVAVGCDRVLGDQEAVVKSLGPVLEGVPGYLGAAILSDGRVALILDPSYLLRMPSRAAHRRPEVDEGEEGPAPLVLIVDDQFTVRELQRSILETAGYRVDTARDGAEALERLSGNSAVDMVLTDIQMPEIDGFQLLKAIRQDPDHSSLPVVIVTSQGGDDNRRRGVEEGADAYIVKEEFDQHALLETIGRLVGR